MEGDRTSVRSELKFNFAVAPDFKCQVLVGLVFSRYHCQVVNKLALALQAAVATRDDPLSGAGMAAPFDRKGFCVNVVLGSHTAIREMAANAAFLPDPTTLTHKIMHFRDDEAFFFSQDFTHSGETYPKHNVRAFVYFDHRNIARERDATYPLETQFPDGRRKALMRQQPATVTGSARESTGAPPSAAGSKRRGRA